ncbi:MAG: hypothetical protein AAGA54_34360 [Myxococcota bacterium]
MSAALAASLLAVGCGDDVAGADTEGDPTSTSTSTGMGSETSPDATSEVGSSAGSTTDDGTTTGEGSTTDDGTTSGDGSTSDDDTTTGADDSTGESGSESTGTQTAMLVGLTLDPANTVLAVGLDTATSQAFTAMAEFDDGSTVDVTASVTWETSNPVLGAMNADTLEVPGFPMAFAGSTVVSAALEGETAQTRVTVAAYPQADDAPTAFFVLPFEDPTGNQAESLSFQTSIEALDVFFNADTTASMDGEVTSLQQSLGMTIIPGITAQVANTWFGVGGFEDFPIFPYGEASCTYGGLGGSDQPFELFTAMTDDVTAVQGAVDMLGVNGEAIGCGSDSPESGLEAMYQIATGEGLDGPGLTSVPANGVGLGGVGFRADSMPVIVNITDTLSHDAGPSDCSSAQYTNASVAAVAHTADETLNALDAICARVVQVSSNPNGGETCSAQADGIAWNLATGAVVPPEAWDLAGHPPGCEPGQCCTGLGGAGLSPNEDGLCPLTFTAEFDGTGVDTSIVTGVEMLSQYAPIDVDRDWQGSGTDIDGTALPSGTTADFIKVVAPQSNGPGPIPGAADPVLTPTVFEDVIPGTEVTFSVQAYNDFLPQTDEPQLFVATVRALANGCSSLDTQEVYILVPPTSL